MIIYDSDGRIKETQRISKSLPYFYPQYNSNGLTQLFAAGQVACTAFANASPPANFVFAMPIIAPPRKTKLIGVQWTVQTAAAGSGVAGVYSNTSESTLYPSGLIWRSSAISQNSTGAKLFDTSILLEPGKLYWLAYFTSIATSIRTIPLSAYWPILGFNEILQPNANLCYALSRTYDNILPNPYPTGAFVESLGAILPAVGVRFGF